LEPSPSLGESSVRFLGNGLAKAPNSRSLGRTLFLAILSRFISEPHPDLEPLPESEFKERVKQLAVQTGFPVDAVMVEGEEDCKTDCRGAAP
jgi:hypothetical protein